MADSSFLNSLGIKKFFENILDLISKRRRVIYLSNPLYYSDIKPDIVQNPDQVLIVVGGLLLQEKQLWQKENRLLENATAPKKPNETKELALRRRKLATLELRKIKGLTNTTNNVVKTLPSNTSTTINNSKTNSKNTTQNKKVVVNALPELSVLLNVISDALKFLDFISLENFEAPVNYTTMLTPIYQINTENNIPYEPEPTISPSITSAIIPSFFTTPIFSKNEGLTTTLSNNSFTKNKELDISKNTEKSKEINNILNNKLNLSSVIPEAQQFYLLLLNSILNNLQLRYQNSYNNLRLNNVDSKLANLPLTILYKTRELSR